MLADRMDRFNEWWATGKVRAELAPDYHRKPFDEAAKLLGYRQALILTGLRRVGKSTMLYQLAQKILREAEPSRLLYFSFEEGAESASQVLTEYETRVLKRPIDGAGKVYVLLDEVQYARDWVATVKRYYDIYPNVKFVLSGSSSLLISGKARGTLAGRFFFVEAYPMTFMEFAEARGQVSPGGEATSRLEPLFADYLGKAGFPEVVRWDDESRVEQYVRNSVIDRVIFRDVPSLTGQRDPLLMGRILETLVTRPGSQVNLNKLSMEFGASRVTLARYLRAMEVSLLLRGLSNFRPSTRSSSRKLKKFYPATTSLVKALSKRAFESDGGGVLETYAVNALAASYYYRTGRGEIDAVSDGGETAVEAKLTPDLKDASLLIELATRVGAKRKVIVSSSERGKIGGVDVVPAYALEWEVRSWRGRG